RVRLACGALRLDLLGRLTHQHQRVLRSRYAALEHDQVPLGVDTHHLVGPGRRPHVPHLAGHTHTLEHTRRVGGADGARLADVHGAVRFWAAAEFMPLDETLEALALAGRGDVDQLAGREQIRLQL